MFVCIRAVRAARLFLLTRPIKFLICGVVVAVAVVDAKLPNIIKVHDGAHSGLQHLDSFDANLVLLKHKLDSFNANLNSQKRKLDSFIANLSSQKLKL